MNIKQHKKTILIYLSLSLASLGVIVIAANFDYIKFILQQPPKPILINKNITTSNYAEFEGGSTIQAVIRNDGGDGYIVLLGNFYQGKQKWTSDYEKFFRAGQVETLSVSCSDLHVGWFNYDIDFHSYKYRNR